MIQTTLRDVDMPRIHINWSFQRIPPTTQRRMAEVALAAGVHDIAHVDAVWDATFRVIVVNEFIVVVVQHRLPPPANGAPIAERIPPSAPTAEIPPKHNTHALPSVVLGWFALLRLLAHRGIERMRLSGNGAALRLPLRGADQLFISASRSRQRFIAIKSLGNLVQLLIGERVTRRR